jgi:hypothetical protein
VQILQDRRREKSQRGHRSHRRRHDSGDSLVEGGAMFLQCQAASLDALRQVARGADDDYVEDVCADGEWMKDALFWYPLCYRSSD